MMSQGNVSTTPADGVQTALLTQKQNRTHRTLRRSALRHSFSSHVKTSGQVNKAQQPDASDNLQVADDGIYVRVTVCSFAGALASVLAAAAISLNVLGGIDTLYMIVAFGLSAVTIFGLPSLQEGREEVRRQRKRAVQRMITGHAVCAAIGVAASKLYSAGSALSGDFLIGNILSGDVLLVTALCGAAVLMSCLAMKLLRGVHYPALITALAAVTGSSALQELGFWFVAMPVVASCTVMGIAAFCVCRVCGRTKQA